jgi:hypothetical protein
VIKESKDFIGSYVIFISQKSIDLFKTIIQESNIQAQLYKADFDKKLAMIVLPFNQEVMKVERELFDKSREQNEGGFWGQIGVGYEGKTWSLVLN